METTTEVSVTQNSSILRINIDGEWTATDFSVFFSTISKLYALFSISGTTRIELFPDAKYTDMRLRTRGELIGGQFSNLEDHLTTLRKSDIRATLRGSLDSELNTLIGIGQIQSNLLQYIKAVHEVRSSILDNLPIKEAYNLRVLRCTYASPGITDLLGAAEAISQIRQFVMDIIRHVAARKDRQINQDKAQEEVTSLRIQNAKEYLELLKSAGYTETEVQRMVVDAEHCARDINQLIHKGKVVSVSILKE